VRGWRLWLADDPAARVYVDRAAGGDLDHCALGGDPVAGVGRGAEVGDGDEVCSQPEADGHDGRAVGSYQGYFAKKLPTKHWFVDLYPYYSDSIEILLCPIASEPNPVYTSATVPPAGMKPGSAQYAWYDNNLFSLPLNFGGYGYNNWLEEVVPNSARSIMNSRGVDPEACRLDRGIDALVKTTQTPLFGDCTWADMGWATEPTPMPTDFKDPHVGPPYYLQRMCVDRHSEAINVNFLDGSTRRVPILELWSLRWHAKWDATKPPGL
jgi:prepilin-type processing-associated H-X9-DG protein